MENVKTSSVAARKQPPDGRANGRSRLATEVAELYPPQGFWTEDDYFSLPETNRIVELVNGKLVIPDLPGDPHQYTIGELFVLLHAFVHREKIGEIRVASLPVRLGPGHIREPDILFLSNQHLDRIMGSFWETPDLAIEVISPRTKSSSGTERTDRVEKFEEYAGAGVTEYWIVDPRQHKVEVFELRSGRYEIIGSWSAGEVAHSHLLKGFEFAVDEIFQVSAP